MIERSTAPAAVVPAPSLVLEGEAFPDLAPSIHRQRLVVEGLVDHPIDAPAIVRYLDQLSEVCAMRVLQAPVTHRSDRYGWAGWVHWEASGAHFYAWERPQLFFSVDLYTCKSFDPVAVVDATAAFFASDRVVAKSF
ncbi:MAG: S-adenosylmethionine decarboxylase [Acidimicrobiales bacterium]